MSCLDFDDDDSYYAAGFSLASGVKIASSPRPFSGKLVLSKNGWLVLTVPSAIIRGMFDAISDPGFEIPKRRDGAILSQIAVMSPEEIDSIGGPDKISERGHFFRYSISSIKRFDVNMDDVSSVIAATVESPELLKVRRSYGLKDPNSKFGKFAIIVAVRKKGVLGKNDVSKSS